MGLHECFLSRRQTGAKPRPKPARRPDSCGPMRVRESIPGLPTGCALLLSCLVCAYTAAAQDGRAIAPAPDDHSAASSRVKSVNERLELALEDGRLLKLAGLDPPRPTPDNPEIDIDSSAKLAAWLAGKDIAFRLLSARPDRWGRFAAQVFASLGGSAAPAQPVAQAALTAGLARFEPDVAARPCRAVLLAAEATARAGALGLWADPYYAVIAADDHDSFAEKAGTSVIVEGRVFGVEHGPFRATLLFGQRWGRDFSVTILQRNLKIFGAAGLDLDSFKGRTIRVRGLLDMRFGPQVEVSSPEEIEAITQATDEAGSKSAPPR